MHDGSRSEISMFISRLILLFQIHSNGGIRSASASAQNTDGCLFPVIPLGTSPCARDISILNKRFQMLIQSGSAGRPIPYPVCWCRLAMQRKWMIFRTFNLWVRDRLLRQESLGIDVAYQALLVESRTVTGSPNPTVNGTYQTNTHVGSMTMRVNF